MRIFNIKICFAALIKVCGVVLALCAMSCTPKDNYIQLQGYAQGGVYSVKLNLNGPGGKVSVKPQRIKAAVDSILNDIDTTLSGYNRKSLLSRFNAGERIPVNAMLRDIYSRAYQYYEETGHALDIASAPLFDMWGFGFTTDSLPSDELVGLTLSGCGMDRLSRDISSCVGEDSCLSSLDLLTDSVKLSSAERPAAKLNFNAIAQGYSCDLVAEYLYSIGVKDMLVDIGEIYCDGVNPDGNPWRVGVDRPFDGNEAPGQDLDGIWSSDGKPCGIVTSGNYRKFYVRDGKKYAHTIDPRTGYPVQHNLLSATIVAKNATDADAYATYCMVIGLDEAKKFIMDREDLAGYLIYSDKDGKMCEWASDNFSVEKGE